MSSSSESQASGLMVLYEPHLSEISVDVIAIHGLGGDFKKSWTHPENGCMWLMDLLPYDLPNARIMSFAWDSRLTGTDSVASYAEWGARLESQLESRRRGNERRPIVIIAHSVGGIIVKHMLVRTPISHIRDTAGIASSVAAILFFGTPHHGSSLLAWSSITLKVVSVLGMSSNKKLLSELRDPNGLENLHRLFFRYLDESQCHIWSFYEMKKTNQLVDVVVPKDSAFLGHPREQLLGISKTHPGLVKFSSNQDSDYYQVIGAVLKSIEEYAARNVSKPINLAPPESLTGTLHFPRSLPGDARVNANDVGTASSPNHSRVQIRSAYIPRTTTREIQRGIPSIRQEPTPRFVFDTLSESEAAETGSAFAEAWFDDLRDKVHQTAEERRKDSDPRVKVAILDSGLDRSHPFFAEFFDRGQIATKSFIEGELATSDSCGHGTHMADLVLRVAPNAQVFMAKIFLSGQSTEMELNKDLIAEAIRYATHTEKADIILMSWGYRKEIPTIRDAIRDSFHHHTILIAAASNSGSLYKESVAFPASLRQVICINSTDGYGNPSEFNPSPTPDRAFAVIGEGLSVACPLKIGNILRVIRGTSAAAAIASGIAALVLQYARQRGNAGKAVKDPGRLDHCDAMRKVFYGMATLRAEYHVLVPAKLYDETDDERHYRISQRISAMLDAL